MAGTLGTVTISMTARGAAFDPGLERLVKTLEYEMPAIRRWLRDPEAIAHYCDARKLPPMQGT